MYYIFLYKLFCVVTPYFQPILPRKNIAKKNKNNSFLHVTQLQSIFSSCFNLFSNSAINLLDFAEPTNRFHISVIQNVYSLSPNL